MEENTSRWLALREAGRRILVEQDLIIAVPTNEIGQWQRLVLNMADAMPQRLEFPEITVGTFSVLKEGNTLLHINTAEPESIDALWLPYNQQEIIKEIIQMCSELLLAGFPGCSGCGYLDDEENWNEASHRERLKKSGH